MRSTSSTLSAVNTVNAVTKVNAVKNSASAVGGRCSRRRRWQDRPDRNLQQKNPDFRKNRGSVRSLRLSKPQSTISAIYRTIRIGKRARSELELVFSADRKIYGGFKRQDLSQDPLRYVVSRWVVTVVSSAGIFSKIHYGKSELPQRGIMR
ncbi:MAG: hypothetical protein ACKOOI_01725, partial [Pirellula sp.]